MAGSPSGVCAAALEAALALHRAGVDPKVLGRALRRMEELLDE